MAKQEQATQTTRGWVGRLTRGVAGCVVVVLALGIAAAVVYVTWTNDRGARARAEMAAMLEARDLPTRLEGWTQRRWEAIEAEYGTPVDEDHWDPERTVDLEKDGTRFVRAALALIRDVPLHRVYGNVPAIGGMDAPDFGLSERVPEEANEPLARFVADQRPFFELMDEGLSRSYVVHGVDEDVAATIELDGGLSLIDFRNAARVYEAKALHAQAEGDVAGAVDAIERMLDLNDTLRAEPTLIVSLVADSIDMLAVGVTEGLLSRFDEFPESELERLQRRLEALEAGYDKQRILASELTYYYEHAGTHEARLMHLQWSDAESQEIMAEMYGWEAPTQWDYVEDWAVRQWVKLCPGWVDLRIADEFKRMWALYESVREAEQARDQASLTALLQQQNEDEQTVTESSRNALRTIAATRSRARTAAAGIAVERYRLEHGEWPGSLADADVRLLADPMDPEGQELRYRQSEEGVRVWSVGRNHEDDGGYERHEGEAPSKARDLVFRLFEPERRGREPVADEEEEDETDANQGMQELLDLMQEGEI